MTEEPFGCSSICSALKEGGGAGDQLAQGSSRQRTLPSSQFHSVWAGCLLGANSAWQQFLWLLLLQQEFCL